MITIHYQIINNNQIILYKERSTLQPFTFGGVSIIAVSTYLLPATTFGIESKGKEAGQMKKSYSIIANNIKNTMQYLLR